MGTAGGGSRPMAIVGSRDCPQTGGPVAVAVGPTGPTYRWMWRNWTPADRWVITQCASRRTAPDGPPVRADRRAIRTRLNQDTT